MKKILIAIARALAAVPKYTLIWCARAGNFVLSMIPSAQPVTTAAGEEADDALMEIRQAREEAQLFKPKKADAVIRYAAAVVHGSAPPDVSHLSEGLQFWLEDLEVSACRRILKCTMRQIEQHLDPRCASDHLAGVPSFGDRPEKAGPVGYGSKRGNAQAIKLVDDIFAEMLDDPEECYA